MNTPDPRGKTLWEMFRDWMQKSEDPYPQSGQTAPASVVDQMRAEPEFYNPLGLNPGDLIQVNADSREVAEVHDITRRLQSSDFSCADYILKASEPEKVRVYPGDERGLVRIHLYLYEQFPVDPGFLDVVNDTTGVFDITDDNTGITTRYERLHGVTGPYRTSVRMLGPDGMNRGAMEYWDWWKNDVTPVEFVFVERTGRTIQIWRGTPL